MKKITEKFAGFFGPFVPIAYLYIIALPLMTLSRIGLSIWQAERISESNYGWAMYFIQGLRADVIQTSLLAAPLLVLVPFLATQWTWNIWRRVSYFWVLLCLLLLVYMEAATPAFIVQYDFRPNRIFVEYLKYPREVFSTIWNGFRIPFIIAISLCIAFIWANVRGLRFWLSTPKTWSYLKQIILVQSSDLLFLLAFARPPITVQPILLYLPKQVIH